MEETRERARLVPLGLVLDLHGIEHAGPGQAVRCPIHKDGQEKIPSAKYYSDNFIYCYKCGRNFDSVEIHAHYANLSLEQAIPDLLRIFPREVFEREEILSAKERIEEDIFCLKLEEELIRYKYQMKLERYRDFCRKVEFLKKVIIEESDENALKIVFFFKQEMEKARAAH